MRRVVQAAIAVVFAVLAFLALFHGRAAKDAENRLDLAPRPSAATPFREETTLRNVTGAPLAYTVLASPGVKGPVTRTLAVGAVDRLASAVPVEIAFDSGKREARCTVHPGKPYSFRRDERGAIRVYPGSHGRSDAADLAPFVPTPPEIVARMLELAGVGRNDVVYDLGCGDGRVVIAAAKTYGARGVGVELDPDLLARCRAGAEREGVSKLVRFLDMDATKARLTEATVVAVYLLPESLESLVPVFERDLRPGARVVSHDYRVPGWDGRLVSSEALPGEGGRDHRILLYRMPGAK
ncbi:MAG TPA: methyltransferase domain-containing protein [Candidatus Aminicenantes bacterium]|nr:methyltransferase domain-containing protein [Candidatus Aminicenantes bacterium]